MEQALKVWFHASELNLRLSVDAFYNIYLYICICMCVCIYIFIYIYIYIYIPDTLLSRYLSLRCSF